MNCYLICWNPTKFRWEDYSGFYAELKKKKHRKYRWSCGNNKSIDPDSYFFFLRQGKEPRGIMGIGKTLSSPYPDKHWNGVEGAFTNYVDIRFETLLDINNESAKVIPTSFLQERFPQQNWTPQGSGIRIRPEIVSQVLDLWYSWQGSLTPELSDYLAYEEGRQFKVTTTKYERDLQARQKCLEIKGYACNICGIRMEEIYGEIGKEFIQVHHIQLLSEYAIGQKTDPSKHLIPVCPNCHAMLHRKYPPYTPAELKKKMKSY
jgi:5-methylcytosine-specific restriction protein A